MTADQAQHPTTPPLAAMVYRVGKGCRQYPFGSVDEFAAWAARKPYCNETLRVMPVKDYAQLGDRCLPAADAVTWVRQVLGGGA